MNVDIFEDERIDDLQFKGLKIIQNINGFCFGIDAVLLANFCKIKKNAEVIDLGTGTGIIPILLSGKSNAKKITGVEIQDEVVDMARRSVSLNDLEEKIEIVKCDIKCVQDSFEKNRYDVVVSNPPYMHSNGLINENDKKAISRHEVLCNLEDVIRGAAYLLKPNGRFFMINRPLRLVDMICYGRQYNLEPKFIRFVHSKANKAPKLVLMEYVKNAKPESKILEPLYVYGEDNKYTKEILDIYSNVSVAE
ncbi:MAG: tRNA1(Val) (adenine(37)-N6)-methyltransferase [Peptostreptococcus porci]|nr:tRNA1(Val) (adenine(37)-N6)-methyltransferase [Peptostreptococcus porci]MDD7182052.1 tRNA1(Val) (adenine(37)-N6)-methyltransferase [Peptostreptococcus porci]MDY6231363.1 tRNA1(Val) (adenine(37)-N6)-methyltransferase [Peptostreptococcus porci]